MYQDDDPSVPGAFLLPENESADEDKAITQSTPPPRITGLLPPTPPSMKPASTSRNENELTKIVRDTNIEDAQTSDLGRHIPQMSPPTPEHTPKSGDLLTPRPSGTLPNHSSAAESFKTAEDHWSSDDNVIGEQTTLNSDTKSSRMLTWLDTASHTSFDDTQARGSGTFWEEMTPQPSDHSFEKPYMNGTGGDGVEREWDPHLMRNVTVRRKRPRTAGQAQTKDALRHSFNVSMAVARIEDSLAAENQQPKQESRSRSSRGLGYPGQSPKLLASLINDTEEPKDLSPSTVMAISQHRTSDPKRFSGGSTTSTVVEAVVVDTSPPVNRRLRHVSKNLDLRDNVASKENVERHSLDSHGSTNRRLSHKKNMVPHPQSFNSVTSIAPIKKQPGNLRRRRDSIPPRPLTAPEESVPSTDMAKTRQTNSLSIKSPAKSSEPRVVSDPLPIRGISDFQTAENDRSISPPLVSPESRIIPDSDSLHDISPPSEPASPINEIRGSKLRHVRKFSNKSEDDSMKDVRMSLDRSTEPRMSLDRSVVSTEHDFSSTVRGPPSALRSGERGSLGYLFSPTSLTSGTPEAMEISEAKAVTLHSHNNNALVVVQNQSTSAPRQQTFMLSPSPPPDQSSQYQIFSIDTATPKMPAGEFEGNLDSPLRNPRAAPAPPVVVIPPTPARDLDRAEAERTAHPRSSSIAERSSSHNAPPKRQPSLLDRARRYSDTFVSPLSTRSASMYSANNNNRFSTLRRGFSLRKSSPRSLTISAPSQPYDQQEQASKLHPFWRPRQFWDDASDSDFSDSEPYPYPDDGNNVRSPYDPDTDRLPAGGDTSDVLPDPDFDPNQTNNGSRSSGPWKRMNSVKGFLIGNSLGLERGPTNKRRHVVPLPAGKRIKRNEWHEGTAMPWSQRPQSSRSEVRESARRSGAKEWDAQKSRRGARRWVGLWGFGRRS